MRDSGRAAMTSGGERFARAVARIDAANAEDPNREEVDGRARPKELVYAERLTAMLGRFDPDASETLRLAARCQHVERWTIPRADYPLTRAGYEGGGRACATFTPSARARCCRRRATMSLRSLASAR